MTIREKTEMIEVSTLSKYAALSIKTKGRTRLESECPMRAAFQRDRDRIIHSNAFRRLKHKTQVFISPEKDHYRTRLTHTLEVAQIARTIARGLRLNEDLAEAIALGHDLGHTPFGHAGERALDKICRHGFRHNLQSVRVVEFLEKEGKGLNLTYEVKNGIENHVDGNAATLEGQLVEVSDKIAFVNHDIEDAIRGGIITSKDIPYNCDYFLGKTKSQRIHTAVNSIIQGSGEKIQMHPEIKKAHDQLLDFMYKKVYIDSAAKTEENKVEGLMRSVYEYYLAKPQGLPPFYAEIAEKEDIDRAVCDYIAGMSDIYLVKLHNRLFVPQAWE
ncbi:MAG: deoxyguanosinetriphosphate triphosphohydrolase [Oscillospiraceae bacterium]|nr:deoxyguanosinetriphosphate triphosphohydrolase [Oscillospiraceae bacterium]